MQLMLYLLAQTVQAFLLVILAMMLIRVVLSLLMPEPRGALSVFVYNITETVVLPVRAVFDKFGWQPSIPLDLPFMVTYFLLLAVQALLPTVHL